MRPILLKFMALITLIAMVTFVISSCVLKSSDDITSDLNNEISANSDNIKIETPEESDNNDYTNNDQSNSDNEESTPSTENAPSIENPPLIENTPSTENPSEEDPVIGEENLPLPGDWTGLGFVSMFPEGWTGGFGQINVFFDLEYWWIETYDELLIAIEKLNSHGSTFANKCVLDYDGDLFDVKYCVYINPNSQNTEQIKFGDDPFDRYASNVYILTYGFLDDVTVDEINYSYVSDFRSFEISVRQHFVENYTANHMPILPLEVEFRNDRYDLSCMDVYAKGSTTLILASIIESHYENTYKEYISDQDINSFLSNSKYYTIFDLTNRRGIYEQ